MLKRVVVSVIGIPFLILVLCMAPDWATMVLVAGMCAVGAWELMHAVRGSRGASLKEPCVWASIFMAMMVPVLLSKVKSTQEFAMSYLRAPSEQLQAHMGQAAELMWDAAISELALLAAVALLFVLVLFVYAIFAYGKGQPVPFADLTAAVFAGLVFPLMLSSLLLLRLEEQGQALVFLPLCISFGSDTLAYFTGLLCGKHKLTPVSPKKTVEGAAGGLAGGVVGMVIFKVISGAVLQQSLVGWTEVLYLGLLGSVVGQIGDLSFSVIKREFAVKDYGNLLPGHGGILDRFDSVTFVAPVVWLLLNIV